MAQSYKSLKEDFVSNLSGGGMSEINWATAVAPVCSIDQKSNVRLTEVATGSSAFVVGPSIKT